MNYLYNTNAAPIFIIFSCLQVHYTLLLPIFYVSVIISIIRIITSMFYNIFLSSAPTVLCLSIITSHFNPLYLILPFLLFGFIRNFFSIITWFYNCFQNLATMPSATNFRWSQSNKDKVTPTAFHNLLSSILVNAPRKTGLWDVSKNIPPKKRYISAILKLLHLPCDPIIVHSTCIVWKSCKGVNTSTVMIGMKFLTIYVHPARAEIPKRPEKGLIEKHTPSILDHQSCFGSFVHMYHHFSSYLFRRRWHMRVTIFLTALHHSNTYLARVAHCALNISTAHSTILTFQKNTFLKIQTVHGQKCSSRSNIYIVLGTPTNYRSISAPFHPSPPYTSP